VDVNLHQEGGYCDLELVCKSNSGTYIHEFEKRVAIHCHIVLSFKPGNTKIRGPYIRDGRKVLGETLLVSNDMSAKCFSCCAFLRRNKSCGSGIQSHDVRVSLAVLLYILRRVRGIPPLFVFYIYLFSLYFFFPCQVFLSCVCSTNLAETDENSYRITRVAGNDHRYIER